MVKIENREWLTFYQFFQMEISFVFNYLNIFIR